MDNTSEQKNNPTMGTIIGIVVILILVVIGGFYFWSKQVEQQKESQEILSEVTSDSGISSLETELQEIDLDNTDADILKIDQEFGSSI